jgi:predicted nucleic acid-binding protein
VIALDTNTLRAVLVGLRDAAITAAYEAIDRDEVVLPPVVIAEALSDPKLPPHYVGRIRQFPTLEIHEGYWYRAGELRASILRDRLRAHLPDTLIAQSCIDHDIPLITYDHDFRHFVRAGLKLV